MALALARGSAGAPWGFVTTDSTGMAGVVTASVPPPYFFDASSRRGSSLSLPEILYFKTRQRSPRVIRHYVLITNDAIALYLPAVPNLRIARAEVFPPGACAGGPCFAPGPPFGGPDIKMSCSDLENQDPNRLSAELPPVLNATSSPFSAPALPLCWSNSLIDKEPSPRTGFLNKGLKRPFRSSQSLIR